ncbi:hypothetical protein KY285_028436 [Solanum tuberosum]|nr:hypothetical protein KY285_028436 [Solanum tuberosum]
MNFLRSPLNRDSGLLEILASASEFEQLPIRPGEEESIKRLINHLPFSFENPKYTDPHVKANALLQAHLSRRMVVGNLAFDQRESSTEVSQMATQGLWHRNSMLLQLPHLTEELVKKIV